MTQSYKPAFRTDIENEAPISAMKTTSFEPVDFGAPEPMAYNMDVKPIKYQAPD